MKRVRDIENIAKKKLFRARWIRGGVGGIALAVPSSEQPFAGPIPDPGIPELERVGPLGSFRQAAGNARDMTSAWVPM